MSLKTEPATLHRFVLVPPAGCVSECVHHLRAAALVGMATLLMVCETSAQPRSLQLPNSARSVSFLVNSMPIPAELPSVAIHDVLGLRSGTPVVRVGKAFKLELHWIPLDTTLRDSVTFIRLEGSGPVVEWRFPIGDAGTEIGTEVVQTCLLEPPRFKHVGDGVLVAGLDLGGESDDKEVCLGAWPVHVAPIVITSTIPRARLLAAFGTLAVPTGASFRLGPGSRISVPVPAEIEGAVTAIGLVSSINYGNLEQGEAVMEITVEGPEGRSPPIEVRAGVHTSLENHDKLRPGTQRARKVVVFDSWPDARLNWEQRSYMRHNYVGRIGLTEPTEATQIEFQYTRDTGMIDVKAVALVTTASSEAAAP